MQKLPPLVELRAFDAAARHLSFKKAAAELGVTPTAISHQIRLLERYCGRTLFRRRPRPLSLTDAGVRLLPAIRGGLLPLRLPPSSAMATSNLFG
jgi:LysR family glycine cleavage system transcriptional activator